MEKTKELVTKKTAPRSFPLWDVDSWFNEPLLRPFSPIGFPRLRSLVAEEIMPSVDIFEEGEDLVVKAELPGIKKEEIDVRLTDGMITISGEKKKEEEIKRKDYYKWERSYGSFCRSFDLPVEVQKDKVKSIFKNGVLEIRMPKSQEAISKEVKIQVE
jgi:HSP20 family protein